MSRRTATSGSDEVLRAQGNTVRVLHALKPMGVAMAGAEEFDPYKD